jgi:pectinesterase
MRPRSAAYPFCVLAAALALATAARAEAAPTCFPANNATRVNPDTHLLLTFSSPPTLGKSGQIRIYDAAGHQLVDTLDLSIPAGPDPSRRIAAPPATGTVLDPSVPTSPTTTTSARENHARRSAQLPAHYHRRFG